MWYVWAFGSGGQLVSFLVCGGAMTLLRVNILIYYYTLTVRVIHSNIGYDDDDNNINNNSNKPV